MCRIRNVLCCILLWASSALAADPQVYLSSDSLIDLRASAYHNVLNLAVAAAAGNTRTLYITKTVTVSTALTVPNNVTLWFVGAGKIDCEGASSLLLTVQGPIEAGDRNVFDNCPTAALSFSGNTLQHGFKTSWFDSQGIAQAVLPTGAMLDMGHLLGTTANTYTAGAKQTFVASATTAGLNITQGSGQPSAPASGDLINNAGTWQHRTASAWKTFAEAEGLSGTAGQIAASQTGPNVQFSLVNPQVVPLGSGAATGSLLAVYDRQVSAAGVGNGADTTDDPLFTIPSIPANTLNANGKRIVVEGEGSTATGINNKVLGVLFQGVQVNTATACQCNNIKFSYRATITRVDATHVHIFLFVLNSNANILAGSAINQAVSDLTANASVLQTTGKSSSAGLANEVRMHTAVTTISQ